MDKKAQVLNEKLNARRRDEAREAYRRQGGDLFQPTWMGNRQLAGERLLSVLVERGNLFRRGICPPDQFDSLDYGLLKTALTLGPFVTYDHVSAGQPDSVLIACDEDSPEIRLRNRIVDALSDYCRNAAALAQQIHSAAREGFVRAFARIGTECQEFFDGCPESVAAEIVDNFSAALTTLWADLAVHDTLKEWENQPKSVMLALGAYVKGFVECCYVDTRTVKFTDGKGYAVPRNADKAWDILKRLLETDDPEGYVELPKKWNVDFRRTCTDKAVVDPKSDLTKLRYHIFAEKGRGRRGTGRFRLESRPNKEAFAAVLAKYKRATGEIPPSA